MRENTRWSAASISERVRPQQGGQSSRRLQVEHMVLHCAISSDLGAAAESIDARRRARTIRTVYLVVIMLFSQATARVGSDCRVMRDCMTPSEKSRLRHAGWRRKQMARPSLTARRIAHSKNII